MPNKIIVEIEALDFTINERDVAEALKAHFPNMPTRVRTIPPPDKKPTTVDPEQRRWSLSTLNGAPMSLIILNVPQAVYDDYQMNAEEWKELAVHKDKQELSYIHGDVASNGWIMFIANHERPCLCNNAAVHEKINSLIRDCEKTPYAFSMNRQFLIEALAGMNPDNEEIQFFVSSSPEKPVVLRDASSDRVAILMPMLSSKRDLSIPKVIVEEIE